MDRLIYDRGELKLGLERMYRLMDCLGNPQNKVPVIHIAGTNGKGSTGIFIRTAFSKKGIKTGHYQTPAVFDPMDIISIDGQNITQSEFDSLECEINSLIDAKLADDRPTKFEIDTAIAFLWFERMRCDAAVIEVGLGGDTDATNVSDSTVAAVITSIGMDHMNLLGNTLAEIATHKAGIMRKNAPTITVAQTNEAMEALSKIADKLGTSLIVADTVRMKTKYQEINAGLAIEVINQLSDMWPCLKEYDEALLTEIFESAVCFGRFFTVGEAPLFIVDGAHNVPAAIRLKETLDDRFGNEKLIFVTGAFSDKEYVKAIGIVTANADRVYTVKAPGGRGVPAKRLAEELEENGLTAIACQSVGAAVKAACRSALIKKEPIIAFGSLSWLKEAKESYDSWKQSFS